MSTLIVYSGKYGTTEKCARLVAEKLAGQAELVNLRNGSSVDVDVDVDKYDKIIVGGSIYAGRIRKEVTSFCEKNLEKLKGKELGLFICGMSGGEVAEKAIEANYPLELQNVAKAKDYFGGEFKFDQMGFMDKFIARMVAKTSTSSSNIQLDRIQAFAKKMG